MAGRDISLDDGSSAFPLDQLPKTALQAIYHAATGKTETLSKNLTGNVLITATEVDRLFSMIVDQLGHYELTFPPTVTVVVKCANQKSYTYSSWERFKTLRVDNHELTSELLIKFEFVIKLPKTTSSQRCTVSIALDSSLPVVSEADIRNDVSRNFAAYMLLSEPWRAVGISIDFVDFLIAKIFAGVIEDWFNSLKKTDSKKTNAILFRLFPTISSALGQFGRMGMASFLMGYAIFTNISDITLKSSLIACAIGLIIWATYLIFDTYFTKVVLNRISKNIIPAVVLISDVDNNMYNAVLSKVSRSSKTVIAVLMTGISAVSLNILASYIYSYLTAP